MSLILAGVVALSFSVSALATTNEMQQISESEIILERIEDYKEFDPNLENTIEGLSPYQPMMPDEITRGTKKPSKTWNILYNDRYTFSGSSAGSDLYTDWFIQGLSINNNIKITYRGNSTMIMEIYKDQWFADEFITSYALTRGSWIAHLPELKHDKDYYIKFSNINGNFEGSIG